MSKRRIPSLMATQHPDNASVPYWKTDASPFINTLDELEDAIRSFKDLNATEYMWDWEGKFADASIIDRLYSQYIDYFQDNPIGEDKYITFRLPNMWQEKGYNLLQAMNAILVAEDQAKDLGFKQRPLFEVILPMTENADQLVKMHELFHDLATFKNTKFNSGGDLNQENIKLIPLVESVPSQQGVGKLLDEYYQKIKKSPYKTPSYIRPFIACSDPAIVSGWLATKLANKSAVSQSYHFAKKYGIEVYPITGVGSLTFRGGLSPETYEDFIKYNPGVRTVSIQSAFRFDYPKQKTLDAATNLTSNLRKYREFTLNEKTHKTVDEIINLSQNIYQKTLKNLLPDMQPVFSSVPKRRERRQHTGLLSYGRSSGGQKMPRAITFTASFYSLGVPPEFIGLGRSLVALDKSQKDNLHEVLKNIETEVNRAGRYLNKENLSILAGRNKAWKEVQKDVELAENYFATEFAPKTNKQKSHRNLTANSLIMKNNPTELNKLITDTALLRRSLG